MSTVERLLRVETDARNAPDLRRLACTARNDLMGALQSRNRERIAQRQREAEHLLTLWADYIHGGAT